jgi:hypothetical protein
MDTLTTPPWMPSAGTADAIEAGIHWDAVVTAQHIGLAALERLDHETGHRPGPVVWDPCPRLPRTYFLIPAGTCPTEWRHERHLSRGTYVTIPGPTSIAPPGPHWLVPPHPDCPDSLVDAGLLRRALDRVRTDTTVEYCPTDGRAQRMLVTSAQLYGRACIICGAEDDHLVNAGYVLTPPEGTGRLPWPVVACPTHGATGEVAA